jgi:hypothetical protein
MRVNNHGNKRGAGKPEKYAKNSAFLEEKTAGKALTNGGG